MTYSKMIRTVYAALITRDGKYYGDMVLLSEVRRYVGGDRDQVDAALVELHCSGRAIVDHADAPRTLTQADWDAAVMIGNEPRHRISFDPAKADGDSDGDVDPATRPLSDFDPDRDAVFDAGRWTYVRWLGAKGRFNRQAAIHSGL